MNGALYSTPRCLLGLSTNDSPAKGEKLRAYNGHRTPCKQCNAREWQCNVSTAIGGVFRLSLTSRSERPLHAEVT